MLKDATQLVQFHRTTLRRYRELLVDRQGIPTIVIPRMDDRSWVGGLVQGEGSVQTHYVRVTNSTTVVLGVGMTDSAPVFRFSELVGVARPSRPKPRADPRLRALWLKEISGLRAFRVLSEILPFLEGQKSREAQRALEFFRPEGYHRGGCFRSLDVWPVDEFPLRRRHPQACHEKSSIN